MSNDLEAIAAALRELPGVAAASVHPDDTGGVDSLRLGLAPDGDGLAVAGAASRLMAERFGTRVHAEQVQVVDAAPPEPAPQPEPVQPEPVPPVPVPPQRAVRPEIVRTDLVTSGLEFSATVVLSSQARAATGDAHGAVTASGMQRAIGQATLRAVERLARDSARIELDSVMVAETAGERTVLVALTLVSSRGAERLAGSAVVREDESRAIVRATLDALNRRLETLLA